METKMVTYFLVLFPHDQSSHSKLPIFYVYRYKTRPTKFKRQIRVVKGKGGEIKEKENVRK
jgi:hypothetical protein